ncbi:unnamed protein product [marine sediment metagenome]|uniref:Uncharacterized protein n=1 Tax=marine sediment metagenome TaxID=412755 RepID=X1GHC6_9ZZZZ
MTKNGKEAVKENGVTGQDAVEQYEALTSSPDAFKTHQDAP